MKKWLPVAIKNTRLLYYPHDFLLPYKTKNIYQRRHLWKGGILSVKSGWKLKSLWGGLYTREDIVLKRDGCAKLKEGGIG
jgi:hypothetical protein